MLGKKVHVVIDRPMGSAHPRFPDLIYPVNYGYVPGVPAADGQDQDCYVLGVNSALDQFDGIVIAVIHRDDDVEEKWVAAPLNARISLSEIRRRTAFQEKYFQSSVREFLDFENPDSQKEKKPQI